MIELHYAPTPNGHKITIALEEMALPYEVHRVDIGKGDQFKPEFLAFSPNNRIPAIIDHDGPDGASTGVFESGAILIYLAEKTGKLLPAGGTARKTVMEWLMWQMGGIGPMLGQAHHFNFYAKDKIDYAMTRYSNEANRLYGVLDRRLEGRGYVADDFSIADIAGDPQYRARDMILNITTRDGYTVDVPGIVPKLSATPGGIRSTAPRLGEDTEAVLKRAGVKPETIADLRAKGVI
ncbi:MAG: glutathione S-transferase N-terminal domain-containing protein [Rhodobiaceae bacterium]